MAYYHKLLVYYVCWSIMVPYLNEVVLLCVVTPVECAYTHALHYVINFRCVVNINPDVFVTTPHGNGSFLCSSFTSTLTGAITGVQWLVNNTMIEDIIDINITTKFSNSVGIGIGRLNLTNIPMAYNNTNITCIAQSGSGQKEVTASVLIQGLYRIEGTLY